MQKGMDAYQHGRLVATSSHLLSMFGQSMRAAFLFYAANTRSAMYAMIPGLQQLAKGLTFPFTEGTYPKKGDWDFQSEAFVDNYVSFIIISRSTSMCIRGMTTRHRESSTIVMIAA